LASLVSLERPAQYRAVASRQANRLELFAAHEPLDLPRVLAQHTRGVGLAYKVAKFYVFINIGYY
jgi:hypothetical protein